MTALLRAYLAVASALTMLSRFATRPGDDPERGDVPGWVLVTVMTAGLVAALGIFARAPLENAFQHALDVVTGGSSSAA